MESALLNILLAFIFCFYGAIQVSASTTCPADTNYISLQDMQHAAEFTKISYLKEDVVSTSNGFVVLETIHKSLNNDNEIKVVIAENAELNERVIAFRGTDGKDQLVSIAFASLWQQNIDDWFPAKYGVSNAKVNKYFLSAFDLVLPALEKYMETDKKIIFTGHSLGGALASLLALHSALIPNGPWSNKETCLITFGQPKIGNEKFVKIHDEIISSVRKMILIVDKDNVPRLPPSLFFAIYKQLSGEIVLALQNQNKNAYVCTTPSVCDAIVARKGTEEDHKMNVYTSFLTSQSKWYGRDQKLKSSMEEALSKNC